MKCNICMLDIGEHDVIAKCPRCGNEYHASHITEWLKSHNECPMCHEKLQTPAIRQPESEYLHIPIMVTGEISNDTAFTYYRGIGDSGGF